MKVNGGVTSEMDGECRYGLMVPNMRVFQFDSQITVKANGEITKLMEKESFGMLMEMFLKVIKEFSTVRI